MSTDKSDEKLSDHDYFVLEKTIERINEYTDNVSTSKDVKKQIGAILLGYFTASSPYVSESNNSTRINAQKIPIEILRRILGIINDDIQKNKIDYSDLDD